MAPAAQVDDDFDAWYTDTVKPYRFRLLGKVWQLPGAAPAVTVLRLQRLAEFIATAELAGDEVVTELPDGFSVEDMSFDSICRELAGDEMVDQWLEDGLTDQHLPRVAQKLFNRYVLKITEDDDAAGKAPKQPQDRKPPAKKTAAKKSTSSRRT